MLGIIRQEAEGSYVRVINQWLRKLLHLGIPGMKHNVSSTFKMAAGAAGYSKGQTAATSTKKKKSKTKMERDNKWGADIQMRKAELAAAATEIALCDRETEAINEGTKEDEEDVHTYRPQGRS